MDLKKYIDMENAQMPADIAEKIATAGGITSISFEDKNLLLQHPELKMECGYDKLENGDYLVAMYCPMPEVTREMIEWWFWWHPQANERYEAWYPGEHTKISYAKKDAHFYEQKTVPTFEPTTQYPYESVGALTLPLAISFVSPASFGYAPELMKKSKVSITICGHVGAFKGIIQNTEMSHIFFEESEGGLLAVSRFWLGARLKNKLLRKIFLTEKTAKDMATHACIEYRNFATKIPMMYAEWKAENNT